MASGAGAVDWAARPAELARLPDGPMLRHLQGQAPVPAKGLLQDSEVRRLRFGCRARGQAGSLIMARGLWNLFGFFTSHVIDDPARRRTPSSRSYASAEEKESRNWLLPFSSGGEGASWNDGRCPP
jgi:hypothetical protein